MAAVVPTDETQSGPQVQAAAPGAGIADPGPLGLAAFALTTFLLSCFNAGLVAKNLEPVVLPVALFYGGTVQVLAGMWEFRKGNTFGALAFSSYGAFWLSLAAYVKFVAPGLPANSAATATGLFLLAWTIFTAYMTVIALRINRVLTAVFIALLATFVFLTVGALAGSATIGLIGGYLGILTALAAWYASYVGLAKATPRKPAAAPTTGS